MKAFKEFIANQDTSEKQRSLGFLNDFQKIIIDFSNKEGISLRDNFETVGEFKNFVMSLALKMLVDMGFEVKEAFDLVHGSGAYVALADSVWESLQD